MDICEKKFGEIKDSLTEENVKTAIQSIFHQIESNLKEIQYKKFKNGEPRAAYVGSCGLLTLVLQDKIYIANLGDSQGVIICSIKSDQHWRKNRFN